MRLASSRSAIAPSVVSLGSRSPNCTTSRSRGAAGTMQIVTWPASSAVAAGMHRTRAISGAASRVSSSKSSAVTARLRVRSISGPRMRASSTDSASTPPVAPCRFVTDRTKGIDVLSVRIAWAGTLPRRPPPTAWSRMRMVARCSGIAPYTRTEPSS